MATKQVYGKYGTLAKMYLMYEKLSKSDEEHEPARAWALGQNLPEYLHDIDRQADELFDTKRTGDYLTDVRRQNELRQRIEEEILSELVYV